MQGARMEKCGSNQFKRSPLQTTYPHHEYLPPCRECFPSFTTPTCFSTAHALVLSSLSEKRNNLCSNWDWLPSQIHKGRETCNSTLLTSYRNLGNTLPMKPVPGGRFWTNIENWTVWRGMLAPNSMGGLFNALSDTVEGCGLQGTKKGGEPPFPLPIFLT